MSLVTDLEKIGLTEKESKVYLAALELGQSSVQDIAKKSGINRATAYVILDSLIEKGLASTVHKDKKTFYGAESPEVLDSLFEVQKSEINEKQKNIHKILPQLKSIYNAQDDKPVIRYFEGKEGLRAMTNELLSSKDKLARMIYPVEKLQEVFLERERLLAREERVRRGIKTKVLYTKKEGKLESTKDGERIKISDQEFPINSDVALFDNKIRIASFGKKFSGVIIQDEDMYKTLTSLFDLAWEAAKAREEKNKK